MPNITRIRDRIIVGIFLVLLVLSVLNVLLGWGFFGDRAKGAILVVSLAACAFIRLVTPGVTLRTIFDARYPEAESKTDEPDDDRDIR